MKKSVIYILGLIVFICSCKSINDNNHKYEDLSDMLKIDSCEIFSDKLVISYTIENTYDYDIWICEGINSVGKADIGRKGKDIYLRFFSSLPYDEESLIYAPPLAYYSKLSPNSSTEKTISIDLPITSLSIFDSDKIKRMDASRLIFQVGFITADDVNKLGIWAKKDLNEMLLVQVIRDVKIDEKINKVEIDNLKIPIRKI